MSNVSIHPAKLSGRVRIPSSKSVTHRALIAAALCDGTSVISGVDFSDDIYATINGLKALGAIIRTEGNEVTVRGIAVPAYNATINCVESGSTLRFLIPIAAALGTETIFIGEGRLPQRPITAYIQELPKKGVAMSAQNGLPLTVSGKLESGEFVLDGDISSQYITGLLFSLPLLEGDSKIRLRSRLESKPYVDLTISCLKLFGIKIEEGEDGYFIPGNQEYQPHSMKVEGDYSQAAFFCVANALGCEIELENLDADSLQGDRKILEITDKWTADRKSGREVFFDIDASDIPDIVPPLAVLASFGTKKSVIRGAGRLKIKESDRLASVSKMINTLGGRVTVTEDGLEIEPVEKLSGGEVDSCGDHRIAMSAAIAAICSEGDVTIINADSVKKSYPKFFEDYTKLGGKVNGIDLG
jgi:3-phosphoshikimate 1-carboxyvinyltransferase